MPEPSGRAALLLVAHGSPDPRHGAAMQQLAQRVRRRTTSAAAVSFLDHQQPTVTEAARLVRPHGCRVIAVSLLLARGYHSRFDVPRQLIDADVEDAGPIGLRGPVVDAAHELLAGTDVDRHDREVAVVLATAGSGQPAALDDYARFRASLEARSAASVHLVSMSDGEERLRADLSALARSYATLVVVPTLLAPGILSDRLRAVVARVTSVPSSRVIVTPELGSAPSIVDAVLARAARRLNMPRSGRAPTSTPR